ncbi:hypothetical protein KIN20_028703 [Parelaphostrongylus tenuis]|uniref:RRM domain-containing protein n=1 Tax=Parelaphostrongylus tenuis TaxID=148309 RepID=A0AAD5WF07_PARTN|nr:hypothetical protein KIN20_028703 [Parelaphostrongylus tenuis]
MDIENDSNSPHVNENGNSQESAVEFSVELPPSDGKEQESTAPKPAAAPAQAPQVAPVTHAEVLVAMPVLQQHGEVFVGPGSKREAQLLGLGLTKLSSRRKDDLQLAKRYAMDVSIKQIMLRQQKAHHENQQKQAMYAQALSLMARVYIGSISFEVREEMIKKAFEVYGPIKSINMSWDPTTGHHKGFAFLEFDVPEAALLAQESMNGQLMGGRNLKVGRPSTCLKRNQSSKWFNRTRKNIIVHPDLSETDLKSVFEAFGEVVKCQLARQCASGKGSHRGFGYIEFNNAAAMNEAIAGMNMFDLGGQFLRVGRCITPPEALTYLSPQTQTALPTAAAQAAAAVTAKVMAAEASGQVKRIRTLDLTPHVRQVRLLSHQPSISAPKAPATQIPPVSYIPQDYGVPPPPMNGFTPVAPVAPVAPPVHVPPVPPPVAHRGFGGFAQPPAPVPVIPPPAVPPPPQIPSMMAPPPPPAAKPPVPPPKGERTFEKRWNAFWRELKPSRKRNCLFRRRSVHSIHCMRQKIR